MKVSLVHVRLSIAAGHDVPDIHFQAACVSPDGWLAPFPVVDEHVGSPCDNVSPMKPCKWNNRNPEVLSFEGLDENDRHELLIKLKGQRYYRQLMVISYENEGLLPQSKKMENSKNQEGSNPNDDINSEIKSKKKEKKENFKKSEAMSKTSAELHEDSSEGPSNQRENSNTVLSNTSVPFFTGNPAVDITNGILHLYKSNYKLAADEHSIHPDTDTLCMISVPASMDAHAMLEFTAPYLGVVRQIRIIRDRSPNQYMVLLAFATSQDACNFYFSYNNMPYSSLIPEEICHLAFVASIEATSSYEGTDGGFLPLSNSTELPDCMVCLERMDESVQGVLTILCNHSFHATCLRQWEDQCCPVCRYVQTPQVQSDNKCMVCGSSEDLWICLVCGNVGCGRYTSEHAQQHYLETHHNYAMALSDNRVWDYAGDYFVHRLFQNKEDGKLIEKGGSDENEAKIEGIQLECMHLLTSQLESQRKYWEEKVDQAQAQGAKKYEDVCSELEQAMSQLQVTNKKVEELSSERQSLSHRNLQLSNKFTQTLRDLSNERELNKNLIKNQEMWRKKVVDVEEVASKQQVEIAELKEQLRDVMFYIEASQAIKKEDGQVQDDIRDGTVVVGPSTSSDSNRRRKKQR